MFFLSLIVELASVWSHLLSLPFFLFSRLLLLLSESLVFPFVEPRSTGLSPALLNLLHEVKLAEVLNQLLVLSLYINQLLLLHLKLALLLLKLLLLSIILFNLLDKQPTLHTSTPAVLSCSVFEKKLCKYEVLLLSTL